MRSQQLNTGGPVEGEMEFDDQFIADNVRLKASGIQLHMCCWWDWRGNQLGRDVYRSWLLAIVAVEYHVLCCLECSIRSA